MDSTNLSINRNGELKKVQAERIKNIKSAYILQIIFGTMEYKRILEIIKYNKNTQYKLNINLNHYKDYSELFSSIEIEIIPAQNKYGKFMRSIYDKDEEYYQIYFNNNISKAINRTYFNSYDKVTKINIIINYRVEKFEKLFNYCECIESINFKKFTRKNINNMSYMFSGCSSLQEINLSNFDTEKVSDMSYMFSGCSSLKEINLSNFNTLNTINLNSMFSGCSSLKEINLSSFETYKVTNMCCIFCGCSSLMKINISNFNTKEVTNMSYMFSGCSSLKEINLSNFNINKVSNMIYMFSGCSSLLELNFPNFKINKIDMINSMFFGCSDELKMDIRKKFGNIDEKAFKEIQYNFK